jgi:hypothetical protein
MAAAGAADAAELAARLARVEDELSSARADAQAASISLGQQLQVGRAPRA